MQTARGTSLRTSDNEGSGTSGPPHRGYIWPFWAVAVLAYALDQISKLVAVDKLTDRADDVPVIGDLLTLHLLYNPGAAFGLGTRFTIVLSCLALLATVVILVIGRRVKDGFWAVGLGLLLAGVTGNLTDRLLREPGPFRGHVVDFLQLPNWPVFNVADMCINAAAVVIIIQTIRGVRLDGSRIADDVEAIAAQKAEQLEREATEPDEPGEGPADGDGTTGRGAGA